VHSRRQATSRPPLHPRVREPARSRTAPTRSPSARPSSAGSESIRRRIPGAIAWSGSPESTGCRSERSRAAAKSRNRRPPG